jgi:hypothetical protein
LLRRTLIPHWPQPPRRYPHEGCSSGTGAGDSRPGVFPDTVHRRPSAAVAVKLLWSEEVSVCSSCLLLRHVRGSNLGHYGRINQDEQWWRVDLFVGAHFCRPHALSAGGA